jgi:ankyrin repeat protein
VFHRACCLPHLRDVISLILERGLDPNIRDQVNTITTHCLSLSFLSFLLCNPLSQKMNTPLHCAVGSNNLKNVTLLLEAGSGLEIDAKNTVRLI